MCSGLVYSQEAMYYGRLIFYAQSDDETVYVLSTSQTIKLKLICSFMSNMYRDCRVLY